MSTVQNAVVVTATAKGLIYHSTDKSPRRKVNYERVRKIKKDLTVADNKPQRKEVDKIYLNMIQRQMYRRLMYGMKEYDKKQILAMSTKAIKRVEEDFKKAKRAIHILKAKKCFGAETKLISAIFPTHNIGKFDYDWYLDIPKEFTLRKLEISTKEIIDDFIQRKLLPKNFYELTPETVKL
jgi:hypothetical protein